MERRNMIGASAHTRKMTLRSSATSRVNYAGNPMSKPKDMSKHIEDVSGPGQSRPIVRAPIKRYETR